MTVGTHLHQALRGTSRGHRTRAPGWIRRLLRAAGLVVLGLLLLCSAIWGVLALSYFDHWSSGLRTALAVVFGAVAAATLAALVVPRWRWRALAGYLASFVVLLFAWLAIEPSNDRAWQPEVAVLPYATIEGDRITVHNIRNFAYRSETDFTPAYYDKTFDLRQLDSVDLVASYWIGPHIAHTFLSFGFAGKDHVAISIETRKEGGEDYSSLRGFFRQYELYYVVADERDVIRVRTKFRRDPPEDVYVYRVQGPPEVGRQLFRGYMERINALHDRPEFYNTLTTNCTTNIWMHARVNPDRVPFSWQLLASGHVPELLYESGRIDTSMPFPELQRRSRINALAMAADDADDFSQRIRQLAPSLVVTR